MLSDLCILRGVPGHIRSDDGPEFVAKSVCEWIAAVGAKTALHRAGQPLGERLHREFQCRPCPAAASLQAKLQTRLVNPRRVVRLECS